MILHPGSFAFGNNRCCKSLLSVSVEGSSESPQTLAESAAAHQAKQARPELPTVETQTGEEDESNVFQVIPRGISD